MTALGQALDHVRPMRIMRPVRHVLPALVLLTACQSWTASRGTPNTAIASASARSVRITTADGHVMVLQGAYIVGDSLIGVDSHSTRVAIATSHVKEVATKQANWVANGLGIGALLALMAWFSG